VVASTRAPLTAVQTAPAGRPRTMLDAPTGILPRIMRIKTHAEIQGPVLPERGLESETAQRDAHARRYHVTALGEAMFCAQCGNPVADGAKFCSDCGSPTKPLATRKNFSTETLKGNANYLVRHFTGQLSLPVSFWVNGLCVSVIVRLIWLYLSFHVTTGEHAPAQIFVLMATYFMAIIAITAWQLVGIWNSASRQGKREGTLVKLVVVIWLLLGVGALFSSLTDVLLPLYGKAFEQHRSSLVNSAGHIV
jgi:hypothetical protein